MLLGVYNGNKFNRVCSKLMGGIDDITVLSYRKQTN